MAGLIQRRGIYYAQFRDSSRQPDVKRISLGTRRKPEARKKLSKLERAEEEGRFDPWTGDPEEVLSDRPKVRACTLEDAFAEFIRQKRRDGRSENTIRTYSEVIGQFAEAVGSTTVLEQITPSDLDSFVKRSMIAKATQHKRYGHLRTFFRWAVCERYVRKNPLQEVATPDKPRKLPKAITTEEVHLICDTIQRDYEEKLAAGVVQEGEVVWKIPAIMFAFYTGMRASEIARLRWGHIDFEKRLIFIYVQKNKSESTIPLNMKAGEVLRGVGRRDGENYVFESPRSTRLERNPRYFAERLSNTFREARKKAGLAKPLNFHSLRHGFCTVLAESGKQVAVIQAAARHADVSTTMRYIHMVNAHLLAELDDVFS